MIHYTGLEGLTLLGSAGSGTFNVTATAAATPVTVKGGKGNDTFNVGSAGILDGLGSTLTVDGGGGTDTLTADDSGTGFPATRPDPGPFTYTVNAQAVVRQSGSPPKAASSRDPLYRPRGPDPPGQCG